MPTHTYLTTLLALIFLVFGSTHAHTEITRSESALLIVADHSESMHADVPGFTTPSHISVQTDAIVAALDDYLESCQSLTAGYLMWGSEPKEPIWVNLDDAEAREKFEHSLAFSLAHIELNGTNHLLAWDKASRSIAEIEADVSAVIFITDQPGKSVVLRMPPDTIIYKIGIERSPLNLVGAYLENSMAPGQGTVYGVRGADELKAVLDQVIHEVGMQLCVG